FIGAHRHLPGIVFIRDLRNLAPFSTDRHRPDSFADKRTGPSPFLSGMGISVDSAGHRYYRGGDLGESVVSPTRSFLNWTGCHLARDTVFQFLAATNPLRENRADMNPRNFFADLRRRSVYKVAIAYAVVAWLLMQIASQIFPFFDIPNWAVRLVVLLLVIGFPVATILAWAFELTPEGLKRTEFADELPKKSARSHAWIYVVVIAGAISVSLFFLGRYTASLGALSQRTESSEKSIAVLPFENLSDDKANAYFATGIQDEILTRLSKIGELKVISRTSTQNYKSAPRNLPEIARQLGVSTILEGTVQQTCDKRRVTL